MAQSPWPLLMASCGPPELVISTTSPTSKLSKNHLAFSVFMLRQPFETLSLPCTPTVFRFSCRYSPSLEIRTSQFSGAL